ncbi:MAG: hypothetical protein U1E82_07880 [Nitrosomonas sp.]
MIENTLMLIDFSFWEKLLGGGGVTLLGVSVYELRTDFLKNKYSRYRLKKKIEKKSFDDISKQLEEISVKLDKGEDIKELWSDLQTLFSHEFFIKKLDAYIIRNEMKEKN